LPGGRLELALTSGEELWNNLLIPTEYQFHKAILEDFEGMVPHRFLKKWLYQPEASEDFETVALDIIEAIRINGQRFRLSRANKNQGKRKP
jgi:hypothetical protein